MNKYTVKFLPHNISIDVGKDTTIAEAAQKAGVYINNICGGEGVCGKCRIQVLKGKTNQEKEQGFLLACQTEIQDNLEIMIPPESRNEVLQILTNESTEASEKPGLLPLARKIYMELSPPGLEDNTADTERIYRELRKEIKCNSFYMPLECLEKLSEKLRKNEWKITVTLSIDKDHCQIQKIEPHNTTLRSYGIAVDIGTTTVSSQLIELRSGKVIGTEASGNLQSGFGEDIISRISYACEKDGIIPLNRAVVNTVNNQVRKLADENDVSVEDIDAIVASGNTTMSHLLLGISPCSIRMEPYVPTSYVYPRINAGDIGIEISKNGILETLPSVAAYVGGDIVAGVLSCGITEHNEVRALIDIGTNGEIALGNNEWILTCSASAGPAFEGGGTKCGMRAVKGAIERINMSGGHLKFTTIGNIKPRGICGSGMIDGIYELVKNGIINANGKFQRDLKDQRLTFEDTIPQYIIACNEETETGRAIVITESDIDNLIKAKAAVFAAFKSLIDYVGLAFDDLEAIYVAGGFGNFLNIPKSVAIGLLPDIPHQKIHFVGNSSLNGARMCLLSESSLEKCINISKSMTNIELSNYHPFANEYIAALFLPHTDLRLFPSADF